MRFSLVVTALSHPSAAFSKGRGGVPLLFSHPSNRWDSTMNLRRWQRAVALRSALVLAALACDAGKLTEPKLSVPGGALRDANVVPTVDIYVSPHADDWQLFAGNRFAASAKGTTQKVVLIYTSAGDGGRGSAYWTTREAASKASVDTIVGAGSWTCAPQTVNAHSIRRCLKGKVIAYYLRMPDGNLGGDGYGFGSLTLLQGGAPTSAIDGSTTYASWNDFTTTLRTILASEAAATTSPYLQVNAPEYDQAINPNDHADHYATADAVRAAAQGQPWDLGWWVGYHSQNLPANVSGTPLSLKQAEFFQYGEAMANGGYGSPWNEPVYQAWLKRTYIRYVNYVPPTPPVAPSNLAAAAPSFSVTLTWNDNSADETLFRVQRAPDVSGAPGTWIDVVATAPNTVSYIDASASANTTYWYRVRAESNGGLSAYTVAVSVTTPPPPPPPSAPTTLQATAASGSRIDLSWTDVATETSYELERAPDVSGAPGTYAPLATLGANTTGFSDTGLLPSTGYWYRLRSVNPGGSSAYVTASATTPVEVSLVAAYGFNESSGTTTADVSGSNNTGTLGTVTRTTSGKFGGALLFSGNYVTVPHAPSLNLTTAATLEAWVYPTAAPNWSTIFMKEQPGAFVYALYAGAGSDPGGWFNTGASGSTERSVNGSTPLALNTWTHVATTYDGTTARLYINGTQVATTTFTGPLATSTGALRIGGNAVWTEYFTGRIDEVRIYKRALSAAEVVTDMTTPIGGGPPSDATPPTVAITSPSGTGTYTATASPLTVSGTSSDNVAVTTVTWSSDRGGSGTATGTTAWSAAGIVLQPGTNVITVTARDAANNVATAILTVTYNAPDTSAPTIAITTPTSGATYTTQASSLTVGGTASDDVGVTQVSWANDRGGSGTATGTATWTASGIALQAGANVITVTARDAANNIATGTLTVTLDQTVPTIAITTPTNTGTYTTTATPLTVGGTSGDDVGVAQVTWANTGGGSGTAAGTTSWTSSVALQIGENVISATARDAAGNVATATITVTYSASLIAPTNLLLQPSSSTQIDLQWTDNSPDESGFRIERAVDNSGVAGTYAEIATVGANVTAYSSTGLAPGTTYWYRVQAYDLNGASAYTNPASMTTLPPPPPLAPSGLGAQATSATQINLLWTDASTNETGFRIERAPDVGGTAGTYAEIATVAANVTSYSSTALTPSTIYWYRVRAQNGGGTSAYSGETSATTLSGKPNAPTALTATASSATAIALAWTDNATDETGFLVERAPDVAGVAGTYAQIASLGVNVSTYNSTGLTPSTKYWYRVRAAGAVANSDYTNEATATTLSGSPNAPTALTATASSTTVIALAWTDNSTDETGFLVERAPDNAGVAGTYVQIGTVAANIKAYNSTGLTPSTKYWYRVRASGTVASSGYTNEATTTTLSGIPTAPTALTATATTSAVIALAWTDNATDETGFLVERAPDNAGVAGTYVQIAALAVNVKTYSNTGLTPSTKYWYRVRASGAVASSGYTNEATATTLSGIPVAPTALTATASSTTVIALAWTDNSTDETGFLVERAPDNAGVAGTYAQIATVATNIKAYSSSGLVGDTKYWYRVRASGTVAPSVYSNEATATTKMPIPTPPSALVGQAVSGSEISLQWADNSTNEASFRLDRAPNNGGVAGTYALLATLGPNVTTYRNVNLPANTTYWYRIRAQNVGGNSAYSTAISVATLAAPPIAPTALTAKAAAITGTSVTLTWVDNAVDETGFTIEQAPDVGGVPGTYADIGTVATNVKTFTTPALATATAYWFRVRANSTYGSSATTNEVTITTPLAMPTNLGVTASSISGVPASVLTWTPGAAAKIDVYRGATKYRNAITNTGTTNDPSRVLGTTYTYKVCNAGFTDAANCTSVVAITF